MVFSDETKNLRFFRMTGITSASPHDSDGAEPQSGHRSDLFVLKFEGSGWKALLEGFPGFPSHSSLQNHLGIGSRPSI